MKRKRQLTEIISAVTVLIAVAVLCNVLTKLVIVDARFLNKFLNCIRIFIYIGIFSVWGISVDKRVMQERTKRLLTAVSALMVFWLALREIRFRYVINPDLSRYLWYMYYIPLVLIPLLALYTSFYLGKSEAYRVRRSAALLFLPAFALISLVMTNDLHGLVFSFNGAFTADSAFDYKYGAVYYTIIAWIVVCSISALAVMTVKSRLPKSRRYQLAPLIPFAAGIAYTVLYATRIPFVINYLGDLSIVYCLVFTAFFEACIQCGLVQSNTRYAELLTASSDTPVQLFDGEYNAFFKASAAEPLEVADVKRAEEKPVVLDNGKLLHNMPVDGGYAVWTENVEEFLNLRETLEERREELYERNALLRVEYEKEATHKTVEERNRLYDLLQAKTQSRLEEIELLVSAYQEAETEDEKRRALAKIVVLGTYIKRSKDFVLSMEYADSFPELMLTSALNESVRALKLVGVNGSYYVDTQLENVSGRVLSDSYDFFESAVEAVMENAGYFSFRLCNINGVLRINILTDCTDISDSFIAQYPDARVIRDGSLELIREVR
ncbi:MAG: hypothetical protein K6C14_02810 [Eubacterium sp.]|nr:hypothetical protein [Eubacterium sp.]